MSKNKPKHHKRAHYQKRYKSAKRKSNYQLMTSNNNFHWITLLPKINPNNPLSKRKRMMKNYKLQKVSKNQNLISNLKL